MILTLKNATIFPDALTKEATQCKPSHVKTAELDSQEAEAFFGMALAEFKIQYIKDIVNNKLQPICHGITDKQFADNKNYLTALSLGAENQRIVYTARAKEIDYIRKEFFKLKQSGLTYDCFICVKVTLRESAGAHLWVAPSSASI